MEHQSVAQVVEFLSGCLGITKGDTKPLVLIFDRFGQEVAEEIIAGANNLCPGGYLALYVPIAEQHWLAKQQILPCHIADVIERAGAIITCLTNSDTTPSDKY
jgi:hypothetical protein